eukprot:CAMPEP_0115362512 /NCGR_PEP_ID=MMETSP0270-20121206/102743_1 /TAXON_ID=71861 /ORGANISM="Scrippsiella trochoidea, Strain CCMP3099" /LENGTH=250 /DNA_ID=CAMNT_0002785085 /DNA_START=722 /DNA_END=1474 /DNA_ORIENTATION=+
MWLGMARLACSLPEAPRHLLIDKSSAPVGAEEDGPSGVYALLTKWTLGESSGGARQNFFRLLAEGAGRDAITPLAYIGVSSTVRVFIKVFSPSHGLRFEAVVQVPNTENVLILLPPILAALGLPPTPPTPEAGAGDVVDEWCLAWEGSPSDWYRAPLGCSDEEMYSGNGGIPLHDRAWLSSLRLTSVNIFGALQTLLPFMLVRPVRLEARALLSCARSWMASTSMLGASSSSLAARVLEEAVRQLMLQQL